MKILHAITSLDKGGAENHLVILSKEQIRNKNSVSIYISKNSFYWINELKKSKIKVYKSNFFKEKNFFFKFLKLLKDTSSLVKLINNNKPDVLHAHLPYMELISFFSLFFSSHKPKFIITKHVDSDFFTGSKNQKKTLVGSFISKIISLKSYKIVAISKSVKNYHINNFLSIESKKVKVIYYGLDDLKMLSKKEKKNHYKLNYKKKNLVIGCIARLVNQKSIDNILKSISYIKNVKIKLLLVGKGPLKKDLKKISKDLKIQNNIKWINFIDNLEKFYDSIDLFVLTSKYEGLGLVFLEAMLSKKPIISSNTSAMKEIIKNNFNGFLVEQNNPRLLANTIFKLSDKKLRQRLGKSGYRYVKKNFSVNKMYKKTQTLYTN